MTILYLQRIHQRRFVSARSHTDRNLFQYQYEKRNLQLIYLRLQTSRYLTTKQRLLIYPQPPMLEHSTKKGIHVKNQYSTSPTTSYQLEGLEP